MYVVIRVSIRIMRVRNKDRDDGERKIVDGMQTIQLMVLVIMTITGNPGNSIIVRIVYYYYN